MQYDWSCRQPHLPPEAFRSALFYSAIQTPLLGAFRFTHSCGKIGEEEISPSDQEYLEAMEYGMPPNGGIGIGIDRLIRLLTDVKNIKEVILFPTLKPKG